MTFEKDFLELYQLTRKDLHELGFIEKQKVKEAIEKHFVHGFTGDGSVHSSGCRMCKVLKELGL